MRLNIPAIALLTPPPSRETPAGFTPYKLLLDRLVPTRLPVDMPGGGALMLVVPSARATAWGAMAADTVIASAASQRASAARSIPGVDSFAESRATPAPYLALIEDGRIADRCALITGVRHLLERGTTGARCAAAEVVILDFQLTASSLGGATAVGCRMEFAIRMLGASAEFRAPMVTSPLQQADLARNPDALPLDTGFSSDVEQAALADGTPVGGMDWWMSHGSR
jgi:hypothetical protein